MQLVKNKIILIFVCAVIVMIGILTAESIFTKETVIYDIYPIKVVYSEKDADGNVIDEVYLMRAVYTFDSLGSYVPIEYYYSNGTIIFSENDLYPSEVLCSGGLIIIDGICRVWYSFETLEPNETKRVVSGYGKIYQLHERIEQLEEIISQQDKKYIQQYTIMDRFKSYLDFKGMGKDIEGLEGLSWSKQPPVEIKTGIGDSNGNRGAVITSEKITYTTACFEEDYEIPFSVEQWQSLINLIDMEKFYTLADRKGLPDDVDDGTIRYIEIFDGVDRKSVEYGLYDEPEMQEFVNELINIVNCKS